MWAYVKSANTFCSADRSTRLVVFPFFGPVWFCCFYKGSRLNVAVMIASGSILSARYWDDVCRTQRDMRMSVGGVDKEAMSCAAGLVTKCSAPNVLNEILETTNASELLTAKIGSAFSATSNPCITCAYSIKLSKSLSRPSKEMLTMILAMTGCSASGKGKFCLMESSESRVIAGDREMMARYALTST